ncbi:tryptophan synthase subunit alpha [Glycomyces sp. TRM65418]|uniref:tryptophan synthase subunit alpha n=1 Tax=Glycomyces sp. TRM65418 TaxID=2867006 RepID=UPI001CE56E86|nr:tryptophan synthase subunit alpha [Glycomyces sp. TRM65418]MCC3761997.1 tryptophan synthase subunit alpha [Glycomyces sp. TRM65418]QZD56072.1 tryptophan synthase subunit alpha [Glycomyces sp. TRM65418]
MRTAEAFAKTRAEGRAALVGYLPAGFPTLADSIKAIDIMIDHGADIVEVGLPYSDPVMDGPAIQKAADRALAAGFRTRQVFDVVEAVSGRVPILVMTYWNLVERYGVDRFARDFQAAGGAGLITPDLIPDEADEWIAAADAHDLDRIFLVAPSSTEERIASTVAACRGFVYAQSVMGVTGARSATSAAAPLLVERTRKHTDLPIGVGLGVRSGDQAAEIGAYGDAVIVGSAIVNCYLDAEDVPSGHQRLAELTADLAEGVRR